MSTKHAYVADLSQLAHQRFVELSQEVDPGPCTPRRGKLPDAGLLEELLSVAFQASLLRDEDRPVRFRLLVGAPENLPAEVGPPDGLHRLRFQTPRTFDEQEIRRLSQAAKYHRAMIGVQRVAGRFQVWGIVQSGPRWLQSARGGRDLPSPVPGDAIVVRADGPGHIAIAVGDVTLGELRAGRLTVGSVNVFQSAWLSQRFLGSRLGLVREHEAATGEDSVPLDIETIKRISQQMVKRLISTIQDSHHGGTVVFVPHDRVASVLGSNASIQLKYAFADEEPRRRYRSLIRTIVRELDLEAGAMDRRPERITWNLYQGSTTPEISALDEAIMEMSQLIAALAEVDGAVVLTERFEVLGFGGEIVGAMPEVRTIRRARDIEATAYDEIAIDGVGTRHRAAYRLCALEPTVFAVVVSQDDDVQFVANHAGALTYWKHRNAP